MSESQEPAGTPEQGGPDDGAPRREVVVREVDFSKESGGPGGCGLMGCLYGTVAVFAVLLLIVLAIALTRQWMTPVVSPGVGMP